MEKPEGKPGTFYQETEGGTVIKYVVAIYDAGEVIKLGYFATEQEAKRTQADWLWNYINAEQIQVKIYKLGLDN